MNNKTTIGLCAVGLAVLATVGWCCISHDSAAATFQGGTIRHSELTAALEDEFGAEMLQELITKRIIAKAIADNHLALSDVDLALWVEDYQQRPDVQEIAASGQLDADKLRENLRTTVPLYYLAVRDISETEREKFFADHRAEFEQLILAHILLGSEQEAIQLRQRITSPESFATMAIVHSLDDSNRDFSGALGRVTRAELESSFSLQDVQSLFKMAPGTVSRPMKANSGRWHLFLVKKRITGYEELKRQVVARLAEPKLSSCLEKLRDQAQVKILWQPPKALLTPSPSPAASRTVSPSPSAAADTVPAPQASSAAAASPAPSASKAPPAPASAPPAAPPN